MESSKGGRVCVTGAGGFLASWVVQHLLSKGYSVIGTLRNPPPPGGGDDGSKHAHLKKLDKAENLKLVKADLLDFDSLRSAFDGCVGVFHVASPVPSTTVSNPEVELLDPAVNGTLNVLKACFQAKVKRLVFVSSVSALMMNPHWPKNKLIDETSWSDKDYCISTKNWYCLSKTEAESQAWEYYYNNNKKKKNEQLDFVAICPALIVGPMLQSTVNASSMVLLKLLKEGYESVENKYRNLVDVRDVADAILLAYQKPEAQGQRYISTAHRIKAKDLVDKLESLYPDYNYPKRFTETEDEASGFSSEKLKRLGWKYRPLEDTLVDSVESYRKLGILG